jgi:hypothetical protein
MQIASVMADLDKKQPREPGEPVAKNAIDPELIKLARARPKIGVITAAGLVFLCVLFLWRLTPDRRFGGSAEKPTPVTVSDVLAGAVPTDKFVTLDAEPLLAHAIRVAAAKGSLGLRAAPARGTGDRLWLVMSGDGWDQPATNGYAGRLRLLSTLPISDALNEYASAHPRPVFATATAVRAALASGKVATVTGDQVSVADADQVAFDVVDPDAATLIATFDENYPDQAAWMTALAAAGVTPTGDSAADKMQLVVSVTTPNAVATTTSKLEAAKLWGARVTPVTVHYDTTWGALRASPATGFTAGDKTLPDTELDLLGLYVARGIPSGAYALVADERPAEYWYALPITIALALIGVVFAWVLVRAVKRDLLPTRA